MTTKTTARTLVLLLILAGLAPLAAAGEIPAVLDLKEQAAVYDGWLTVRLEKILPELMRREKIDMWLVICREYNEDPVYLSMVPFASLSARRLTMLVMCDRGGDKGVERFSVNRYGIGRLFPTVWKGGEEDQWQALAKAVKERNPQRIGIDESDVFAFGDGLSASLKQRLVQALGPEYAKRLVGAERLAVGWLERRLPEEIEVYDRICSVAHAVIAEAFSAAVITPGVTTAADVEWWIWEKFRALGQTTWFNPGISVQRPKTSPFKDSPVIHPGDLLHCDIGINYLRLNTDTQQHAYVLMPGETDAPKGLKDALVKGNRLQDILLGEMKEGLTGNQILAAALKRAKEEGLRPSIYTHPLGVHGHAAGPTIGLWDKQGGVPGDGDYPLYPDTVFSIELNVVDAVAEWGGQDVQIALEQDAVFTRAGVRFLDRRQTELILVR
ncbi:MAG: Xaa-Pro aminopeptidase [Candidatus Aminicenantes bacterium]|jgi:Xaa-Pro aminopeptidase|nr:Xaa-Pro aminopeptidase [Candidatus Aminicenantes bacterium]